MQRSTLRSDLRQATAGSRRRPRRRAASKKRPRHSPEGRRARSMSADPALRDTDSQERRARRDARGRRGPARVRADRADRADRIDRVRTPLRAGHRAMRWLLRHALQPVAEMTQEAADWSERPRPSLCARSALRRAHKPGGDPRWTSERLAVGLRREQRFSAEMSHELRTPLARIQAEVELALRRERRRTSTAPRWRRSAGARSR